MILSQSEIEAYMAEEYKWIGLAPETQDPNVTPPRILVAQTLLDKVRPHIEDLAGYFGRQANRNIPNLIKNCGEETAVGNAPFVDMRSNTFFFHIYIIWDGYAIWFTDVAVCEIMPPRAAPREMRPERRGGWTAKKNRNK